MMKTKLTYLIVLLLTIGTVFTSCEEEGITTFDNAERFVHFQDKAGSLGEAETKELAIPINYVATENDNPKVVLELSTEGHNNPAIENEDFTISSKEITFEDGLSDTVFVSSIDNDVRDKDKTVTVKIASAPEGVSIGYGDSTNIEYTLTIEDDEHPLAKWVGSYEANATSLTENFSDETWDITTETVEDDVSKLAITGVSGTETTIYGTVDTEAGTISIEAGQEIGDPHGYGTFAVTPIIYNESEDPPYEVPDGPVTGTVSSDGSMEFTNWGHIIVDGTNEGLIYDTYDVIFSKLK